MSKDEEKDKTQLKTDQEIQLKTEKMTEFQSWLALQQRLKLWGWIWGPRDLSLVERMPSKQGGTLVVIQHPQDTPLARHGRATAMARWWRRRRSQRSRNWQRGFRRLRTASNGRRGYVNFLSQWEHDAESFRGYSDQEATTKRSPGKKETHKLKRHSGNFQLIRFSKSRKLLFFKVRKIFFTAKAKLFQETNCLRLTSC